MFKVVLQIKMPTKPKVCTFFRFRLPTIRGNKELAYAGLITLTVFKMLDTFLATLSEAELIKCFVSEFDTYNYIEEYLCHRLGAIRECCAADVKSIKCPHILEFLLSHCDNYLTSLLFRVFRRRDYMFFFFFGLFVHMSVCPFNIT